MSATELSLNESKRFIINNIKYQQKSIKEDKPASCIYLSGPPGCGKSSLIEQIASELGMGLNVQYLATLLLEAFGMPLPTLDPKAEFQRWSNPEFFSVDNLKIQPQSNKDEKWIILFFDDLHLAPKSIQNYLFQLFLGRSIHNKKLPNNFIIILAGNRSTDRAGCQPLMSPVVNRVQMLDVSLSADDWIQNFAINYGVRQDIISFIGLYPTLLQSPPFESAPFASPRSWTYFSDSLNQFSSEQELSTNDYLVLGQGHIGQEYSCKFVEFIKLFCKWNAKEFLTEKVSLPDFTGLSKIDCYTLMSSITSEFIKNLRVKNYDLSNEEIQNEIKVVSELFNKLIINAKEIIPLGLRLIYLSENSKTKQAAVFMTLMKSNPALLEAAKTILNVKK